MTAVRGAWRGSTLLRSIVLVVGAGLVLLALTEQLSSYRNLQLAELGQRLAQPVVARLVGAERGDDVPVQLAGVLPPSIRRKLDGVVHVRGLRLGGFLGLSGQSVRSR